MKFSKDIIAKFANIIHKKYDTYDNEYREQMLSEIFNLVDENDELQEMLKKGHTEKFADTLIDYRWSNSITGSTTGSYFCNSYKAREMVQNHEDLLTDVLQGYFGNEIPLDKMFNYEWQDCLIRDYLLEDVIQEFINIYKTELAPMMK